MKKLLLKNDIQASAASNCALFDPIPGGIFDTCIRRRITRGKKPESLDIADDDEVEKTLAKYPFQRSILKDNILFYIAGFISKKVAVSFECKSCCDALFSHNYEHDYARSFGSHTLLTRFKNRGGLAMASSDVFEVVIETERQLIPLLDTSLKKISAPHIVCRVKRHLLFKCKFGTDCIDEDFLQSHRSILINNIVSLYLKIRMFSVSKTFSDSLRTDVRNKSKKIVDFKGL